MSADTPLTELEAALAASANGPGELEAVLAASATKPAEPPPARAPRAWTAGERAAFHAAGVEQHVWEADAPLPETWTCDVCGGTFPFAHLLVLPGMEPACPYTSHPDGRVGEGWDEVHPVGGGPSAYIID
jgi:hypothetical protein